MAFDSEGNRYKKAYAQVQLLDLLLKIQTPQQARDEPIRITANLLYEFHTPRNSPMRHLSRIFFDGNVIVKPTAKETRIDMNHEPLTTPQYIILPKKTLWHRRSSLDSIVGKYHSEHTNLDITLILTPYS